MKKIMFNDRYGLTDAVLQGRKTMTRRIIPLCENDLGFLKVTDKGEWLFCSRTCLDGAYQAYHVGEEVAIAQNYQAAGVPASFDCIGQFQPNAEFHAGWKNKMFVRADLMPHRIRITNVKVERLQDISNEDAIREGIFKYDKPPLFHESDTYAPWPPHVKPYKHNIDNLKYFSEARFAFAHLIDKVSRKGTWNLNPWVFVYEFELIK